MEKIEKESNRFFVFNKTKMTTGIIFSMSGLLLIIIALLNSQRRFFPIFGFSFGIPLIIFFMLLTEGAEFDLKKNKVRIFSVIFFRIGKWHSLIDFNKIVFREFSFINRSKKNSPLINESKGLKDYQIYLTGPYKKPLKLCVYSDKEKAWNITMELAIKLEYEVQVVKH